MLTRMPPVSISAVWPPVAMLISSVLPSGYTSGLGPLVPAKPMLMPLMRMYSSEERPPWIWRCWRWLPAVTAVSSPCMPGTYEARCAQFLSLGRASMTSRVITCCCTTFRVSTTGEAPETVMVSSTAPTRISAFTFAEKPDVNWMPSRTTVENPGKVNVTA